MEEQFHLLMVDVFIGMCEGVNIRLHGNNRRGYRNIWCFLILF